MGLPRQHEGPEARDGEKKKDGAWRAGWGRDRGGVPWEEGAAQDELQRAGAISQELDRRGGQKSAHVHLTNQ